MVARDCEFRCMPLREGDLVLLPAALTAVACALTLAFGFPGSQRHVPGAKAPAARELVVKSRDLVARARLCRAMFRMPAFAHC